MPAGWIHSDFLFYASETVKVRELSSTNQTQKTDFSIQEWVLYLNMHVDDSVIK
mgnify:CR=1 FL=1